MADWLSGKIIVGQFPEWFVMNSLCSLLFQLMQKEQNYRGVERAWFIMQLNSHSQNFMMVGLNWVWPCSLSVALIFKVMILLVLYIVLYVLPQRNQKILVLNVPWLIIQINPWTSFSLNRCKKELVIKMVTTVYFEAVSDGFMSCVSLLIGATSKE